MRIALLLLAAASGAWCAAPPASLRGFSGGTAEPQRQLEQRARGVPKAANIREYVRRMSAAPHEAGTPASRAVAGYAAGLMRGWGLDTRIEEFEALIPRPVSSAVEMTAPVAFRATLTEPAIPEDPDSGAPGALPLFNAYSADGDVTAPLVYVNYGIAEDYEYLAKHGIDVKGKVVVARYGASWRGVKPKLAHEHGALGCVIYSDPREDGYFQGDMFPKGPYRPLGGAQRGSTLEMALYPGDPLSPGWASEKGSRRLRIEEAGTFQQIPVLPVSARDGASLLAQLGGPVAPPEWRGALPLTYHIGPGPARVRLMVKSERKSRPLADVVVRIPGSVYPDEWVLYGNHHDAWVLGAGDPGSGAAVVLETARSLAELLAKGWKPKRTIVLALWDGEEYGLLGSTEWVEKHAEELDRKAVAYLNTDMYGRGTFGAGGSPSLQKFFEEVARDIVDPESGKSVLGRQPDLMGAPGSGSDYASFVHHVGVPVINAGFGGPGLGGTYHSIYDSFAWYSRFGDPGFTYGVPMTQMMTTGLLRLSEAPVLPFEFETVGRAVEQYAAEIEKLAGRELDLNDVRAQARAMRKAARAYESRLAKADRLPPERLAEANALLIRTERALVAPKGLPGRDWYRNRLYAPGAYTGYAAKTLPGIREAAEAGRWQQAREEMSILMELLRAWRLLVEQATRVLKG